MDGLDDRAGSCAKCCWLLRWCHKAGILCIGKMAGSTESEMEALGDATWMGWSSPQGEHLGKWINYQQSMLSLHVVNTCLGRDLG